MDGEGAPTLPSGTVTFLFTDMEGSTRRWEAHPDLMPACVARHDELLAAAVRNAGGQVVKHLGDGLMAVFADPRRAIDAAIAGQRALAAEDWSPVPPIRVRMGVHSGRATPSDGDYLGEEVNRAARIADSGHGGQIVVSGGAAAMTDTDGIELTPLGHHQLKDLRRPVELHQVVGDGLPTDFPPLRTLELTSHDLPPQRTSFIGRTNELALLRTAIGTSRLTTLVGTGGVGKTRLSLHAAAEAAGSFTDGVRFVELAPIARPEDAVTTLLDRLVYADVPVGDDPLIGLIRHLRGRELLLVLDNCEHLIAASARLVDTLLDGCPGLTLVATSRMPLGVAGETVINVTPFEVRSEPAYDSDALRLFIERAHAAGATPEALTGEIAAIGEICRMVDGLPLGIELAAARVPHLSPRGICDHLARHTKLLVSRDHVAEERHRSLDALLDWSYELLEPVEREVFLRLAVFASPVTLDQVEQVVAGDGIDAGDLLGVLASLVDHSLLRADTESFPTRYSMLRLVHRFARERQGAAESADRWAERHARWVLESVVSEQGDAHDDARLQRFMSTSSDELTAALGWARSHDRDDLVWELIGATWRWWEMRGRAREGLDLFDGVVDLNRPCDRVDWATATDGVANLALAIGDLTRSLEHHRAAIDVFDRHGEAERAAWGRTGLSMALLLAGGDPTGARTMAERALTDFERVGSVRGVGHALSSLGMIAARSGDTNTAQRRYLAALAVLRPAGQRRDAASVLSNLGNLAEDVGDLRRATRYYDGAFQLYRDIDDDRGVALILNNLSIVAERSGHALRARAIAEEALSIFRKIGDSAGEAACLTNLANLAASRDDRAEALALCREGIEAFKRCADARGVVTGLRNAAAMATGWGLYGRAWAWHLDAAELLARLGVGAEVLAELTAVAQLAERAELTDVGELTEAIADGSLTTMVAAIDRARDIGPDDVAVLETEPPTAGFDELTERESELLGLVGEGLANREIAERLFISQRTVDAHLSHIRAKLGIIDRSKLIVAARNVRMSHD